MKTQLILLIALLAVAVCNAQEYSIIDVPNPVVKGRSDTTLVILVYIDTYMHPLTVPNGFALWQYGYEIKNANYHAHDPFYYPSPKSDWYMEFDKYLDANFQPLKSTVKVLMAYKPKQ